MKNEQYLQPYHLATPSSPVGNPAVMVPRIEGSHPSGKVAASFQLS